MVLLAIGTGVVLRMSSAGSLMADLRQYPLEEAVDRYDNPRELLMTVFPRMLLLMGCGVSVLVGVFVGLASSRRHRWPTFVAILPASIALVAVSPASVVNWGAAVVWTTLAWSASAVVCRWRRRLHTA
jgi:hypothetical protein